MIRPTNVLPLKARMFRAAGDEPRLAVLETLVAGEQRVGDLVVTTGQAQSAVSTHLTTLHDTGLLARRQAGREVWYSLGHPAVIALLDAAEEIVVAASGEAYACISPCCNPEVAP